MPSRHPGGTDHSRARFLLGVRQEDQVTHEILRIGVHDRPQQREAPAFAVHGVLAHDFNNFLTVVQGSIEVVMMRLNPGPPVREILEQTASACQRAVFLSSQLLTFAKGGAPIRRVVSVTKLILDAVSLARAGAAVSIDVDIAEDLWPAEVDVGQIGQVFHNILLNASFC